MKVINKVFNIEQSAFIVGRQNLVGLLMLSEIISWYKKKNKELMIFKVDFEKAYNLINWEYLGYVMVPFRFREKWSRWISASLRSDRASVLVNGGPTSELSLHKGLCQGNPYRLSCSFGNRVFILPLT